MLAFGVRVNSGATRFKWKQSRSLSLIGNVSGLIVVLSFADVKCHVAKLTCETVNTLSNMDVKLENGE